jgi:hypothetical protein
MKKVILLLITAMFLISSVYALSLSPSRIEILYDPSGDMHPQVTFRAADNNGAATLEKYTRQESILDPKQILTLRDFIDDPTGIVLLPVDIEQK